MSSSNCASEGFKACGSILIEAMVPSHLAVTFTAPPPLEASTVFFARSAWTVSICCCIRAACFINFPILDIVLWVLKMLGCWAGSNLHDLAFEDFQRFFD